MTSSRWDLITKLFDAALDKPPSERMDFVHRECRGDLDLELQVRKLLAADERAGSFLEQPWLSAAPVMLHLDDSPLLSPGSVISHRFEIVRMLGQGGMGQVYEAFDLELRERIALKAIRPEISSDPRAISRFRREVQLTRRVTHPNVCRTFDMDRHTVTKSGVQSEIMFLTMELLEGETLADLLRRTGRLRTVDALPLVLQMIEALSAAHSAKIVHRDFKPSNVLLTSSGTAVRAVVTDFGLARILHLQEASPAESVAASFTGSHELLGTLVYMAPEQIESGEATVSSDIYSLGLVMFEMVAGRRPFFDPIPFGEAVKRIKEPAPSPREFVPDLDLQWEAVICKCLEVQPKDRFESVAQVAESVTSTKSALPTAASILQKPGRKLVIQRSDSHRSRRWLRKTMLIAGMGLFLVSLFTVLLRLYEKKADPKVASGATVLLTEIQNSTGDKRFDSTTELLRHQLLQSPYFNLMDGRRIRNMLTQMTRQPDSPLDPPTAREVALRAGAPRVIFGTMSSVGDNYVLDVIIERPDNDPHRARRQWENHWTWSSAAAAASGNEIPGSFLVAIRESCDWIRSQVGESANDIARMDAPPEEVTTGSWQALSEFAQAERLKGAGQAESAIIALRNAVAADPHFALAYTRLGDVLVSLSRFREGYQAYQVARAQKQNRLTRREKDRLEGIYASDTEDFKTAEASFRDYTVYYPNDYLGWFYRGTPLMMMGRVEEAIASLKKAEQIDSAKMFAPATIARFDLILNNFADTAKRIQHLRDTGYSDDAYLVEGESNFVQGRYQEALEDFTKLKESQDPLYRSYAYSLLTRLFAEMGQYKNALQALDQGIAEDLATGDTVHRADKILDRAYLSFRHRQYQACLHDVGLSLDLDRSLQRSLAAGTLLGQLAREAPENIKAQVRSHLRSIEARLPEGSFNPFSDIVRAHLRGEILLAEGKWQPALDEFTKADQLEAPAKDKEYLARGLLAASEHTSDPAAARLRESALSASASFALKPGLAWQWAQNYFPGYSSDSTLSTVQLASRLHRLTPEMATALDLYTKRREHGDTEVQNRTGLLLQHEQ
jgi:serine/threonine protein kinase/predicted negative regulator of RcsB-dependent stress response